MTDNCSRYTLSAGVRFPVNSNNARRILLLPSDSGNRSIDSNTDEFRGHLKDEDCYFGRAMVLEFEDSKDKSEPKCWATTVKTTRIWQRNLHRTDAKTSKAIYLKVQLKYGMILLLIKSWKYKPDKSKTMKGMMWFLSITKFYSRFWRSICSKFAKVSWN